MVKKNIQWTRRNLQNSYAKSSCQEIGKKEGQTKPEINKKINNKTSSRNQPGNNVGSCAYESKAAMVFPCFPIDFHKSVTLMISNTGKNM